MPACRPRRRRLATTLHHLLSTTSNAFRPPCSSSSSSSAAATTADHLARLERDGVTIVEDVFSPAELGEIRSALAVACTELRAALPSVSWTEMRYQPELVGASSYCTGRALYEGKFSAGYKNTEIIDLTNGRYDFYGGIVKEHPALATAWKAPALIAIAEAELQVGWGPVGPGTLPTRATQRDQGGMWHRDAYSLFEDEAVDLALPQYELTCLVPMQDIGPGEGGTEFVLGSHRINLSAQGVTTVKAVADWAQGQPRLEAAVKAGSAVLFSGQVLHRGAPVTAAAPPGAPYRSRDVLYFGYSKNWYRSEPDANFLSGSSHPGRTEA
jgi:hypothetical protein